MRMNRKKEKSGKYLLLFFVLTLLWTWICGFLPVVLGITGTPAGTFCFCFGGGAPSVVALFLVFFTYSKEQRRDYFYRCFSFRYMGWKWPLITICIFSVTTILSLLLGSQLLASYTTDMGILIRYVNMIFFAGVMLYAFFSKKFQKEIKEQISGLQF